MLRQDGVPVDMRHATSKAAWFKTSENDQTKRSNRSHDWHVQPCCQRSLTAVRLSGPLLDQGRRLLRQLCPRTCVGLHVQCPSPEQRSARWLQLSLIKLKPVPRHLHSLLLCANQVRIARLASPCQAHHSQPRSSFAIRMVALAPWAEFFTSSVDPFRERYLCRSDSSVEHLQTTQN